MAVLKVLFLAGLSICCCSAHRVNTWAAESEHSSSAIAGSEKASASGLPKASKALLSLLKASKPAAAFSPSGLGERIATRSARRATPLASEAKLDSSQNVGLGQDVEEWVKGFQDSGNNEGSAKRPDSRESLEVAEEFQRQVLQSRNQTLGPEHPDTLARKSILALTLLARGSLKEAEQLQREVLDVRVRTLGFEHPDTLTILSHLAQTLQADGDLPGAEQLQNAVLETRSHILGPEHPDTLSIKSSLAQTLAARGFPKRAEELQREVSEVNSPKHPGTASRRNKQAQTLQASGEGGVSTMPVEELQQGVMEAREKNFGSEHPETLNSKSNLAQLRKSRGDLEGAAQLQREVVDGRVRSQGADHADTLDSKERLANILYAAGDAEAAEVLQKDVLEARIRLSGSDDPDTLKSKTALAVMLQERGDLTGAEELQKRILADMEGCDPVTEPLSEAVVNFNNFLINFMKGIIDMLYQGRDIQRFYVLETIARVPYFAYLMCLHLYESLGMRGSTRRMRTHYAEADNELHHLLIMEELGGSDAFIDRFIAQHLAFGYYLYNIAVYLIHPQAAYHLSEIIEAHAFRTYQKYLEENEEELKKSPVPAIAREYYGGRDALESYLRESDDEQRIRSLNNLYDVFVNVRNDEGAHWRTLVNLVQYGDLDGPAGCPIVATDVIDHVAHQNKNALQR